MVSDLFTKADYIHNKNNHIGTFRSCWVLFDEYYHY